MPVLAVGHGQQKAGWNRKKYQTEAYDSQIPECPNQKALQRSNSTVFQELERLKPR